jgi:hypothetical protein
MRTLACLMMPAVHLGLLILVARGCLLACLTLVLVAITDLASGCAGCPPALRCIIDWPHARRLRAWPQTPPTCICTPLCDTYDLLRSSHSIPHSRPVSTSLCIIQQSLTHAASSFICCISFISYNRHPSIQLLHSRIH